MKNKTLRLVMAALLAAMTCVATMVIKIPITAMKCTPNVRQKYLTFGGAFYYV